MGERMELPRFEDYETVEDYEQAMNMWAHDRLYGEQEDAMARIEWAGEDEEYEDSTDRTCPECNGSGGDKWNDGVIPCKFCHGAGYIG